MILRRGTNFLTYIFLLTIPLILGMELLRINNHFALQNTELRRYLKINWNVLLEGEWIVEYHIGQEDRFKEFACVWQKFADVLDRKGMKLASIDAAQSDELLKHLPNKKFPAIYHVIDGNFNICPGFNSISAMQHFIKHRNWPRLASMQHLAEQYKNEFNIYNIATNMVYALCIYLVICICVYLYKRKDLIKNFIRSRIVASTPEATVVDRVKSHDHREISEKSSESTLATEVGEETDLREVTAINETTEVCQKTKLNDIASMDDNSDDDSNSSETDDLTVVTEISETNELDEVFPRTKLRNVASTVEYSDDVEDDVSKTDTTDLTEITAISDANELAQIFQAYGVATINYSNNSCETDDVLIETEMIEFSDNENTEHDISERDLTNVSEVDDLMHVSELDECSADDDVETNDDMFEMEDFTVVTGLNEANNTVEAKTNLMNSVTSIKPVVESSDSENDKHTMVEMSEETEETKESEETQFTQLSEIDERNETTKIDSVASLVKIGKVDKNAEEQQFNKRGTSTTSMENDRRIHVQLTPHIFDLATGTYNIEIEDIQESTV